MNDIKGQFVKAALEKLQDGNHGSTALGTLAALLLGANLNFGLILQGFQSTESSAETGKALGIVILWVWSYYIGKRKPTS